MFKGNVAVLEVHRADGEPGYINDVLGVVEKQQDASLSSVPLSPLVTSRLLPMMTQKRKRS